MMITTDAPATLDPDGLTEVLFEDGPDGAYLHGHWRKAVSADLFRYRPGARIEERWQLAYDRLRALNAELPLSPQWLAGDPRELAALHEWAAVVDGATATVAGIHYNLFLGSVLDDEVSPPRELGEFASLARIGTFLCTERAHGNDAAALETVARYDRELDGFVLHTPNEGARKYMPNTGPAGGPKTALVAARLLVDGRDQGVFLFLTPLSDRRGTLPGVTVALLPERVGSPVDHCVTGFHHVRLPRTALIQGPHGRLLPDGTFTSAVGSSRKRFLHAIGRVTVGKLCMSASTLGGCRAALAAAVRYAYVRQISGAGDGGRVPLAAHRSHHGRLLDCVATAYAMTFLHRAVTERWITHRPEERAAAERLVAVAKGWITWRSRDITIESRERCGAQGLFPVNGLAEYAANVDGAITAEGDNLAVWCKAGAEMIFGHASAPAPEVATGAEDLTDLAFLRRALAAAEHHWHSAARRDLRGGGSGDGLGRWNNASDAALALVEAYAVGQAADAFVAACARVADPATRAVLADLGALFLLGQVDSRSGLLLVGKALTAGQVGALAGTRRRLVARLAPHLAALTAAFDVPEEHLSSLPMLAAVPVPRP
ncbi:acyl-CoA oxidase [Kitasatospora sp. NBC_00240]|uniref:acyl-CoA dehydrogenase family protein n=1 Tax=Kitasatospora sp. NBC_00240 TaxID=2903567 RepID=UPI0022551790|nr:acyl-CoA dehydrogenase [Kitasatospora sp. NBC_00240]MCX5211972.1 acyl-CoA oxidase [Kitasatospora sp. NBC_00240]